MSGEELRLVATFDDRVSPQMKGMLDRMRQGMKGAEDANAKGGKVAKAHAEEMKGLARAVKETTDGFRGGFLPTLEKTTFSAATAGVGIGSIAAAIGAAAAAAKGFADQALGLKRASRATGLSVDEVRRWQALGEEVGSTGDAMKDAAVHFNDFMQLANRNPDLFRNTFAAGEPANVRRIGEDLLKWKDLPRDEQLTRLIDRIKEIRNVSQQRTALRIFNLPEEFANETTDAIHKMEAMNKRVLTPLTPAQVNQGVEAARGWQELRLRLEDVATTIGSDFVPEFNQAVKAVNELIAADKGLISDDVKTWFSELETGAKTFYNSLKPIADTLNAIKDWKPPVLFDLPKWWAGAQKEGADRFGHNPDGSIKVAPPDHSIPDDLRQKREQLQRLNPGGFHPTAFHRLDGQDLRDFIRRPGNGDQGGLQNAAFQVVGGQDLHGGVSSSASEAIEIIAQGVRKGVFDGLTDFSQSMGGGSGGSGLMNASYEIGGGRGGGSRGGGSGGVDLDKIRALDVGIGGDARQNALAKESYDFWRAQGLSREAALASVGNERGENPLGSHAVGDRGTAFGGFQWHMDRVREILAGTGIDVRTASHIDQLRAARWEAEHGSMGGHIWAQLKNAKDRRAALWAWVHGFERSGNQVGDFARRGGYANAYGRLIPDAAAKTGDGTGPQSLLDAARRSHVLAGAGTSSTLAGDVSLKIALDGFGPSGGGPRRSGNLFKEIAMDRGGIPYADTSA